MRFEYKETSETYAGEGAGGAVATVTRVWGGGARESVWVGRGRLGRGEAVVGEMRDPLR